MRVPRGIDAESDHDAVVPEVEAIEQEDLQVELAQRLAQPLAALLLGERDETTRDGTLRRGACSLALGQPVKAPGITAARHPGRHGRERLPIERVTICGGRVARQADLCARCGARPGAPEGEPPSPEGDRALGAAGPVHGALGGGLPGPTAQRRAVLLHHRAEHLLASVDAQAEERVLDGLQDPEQRQRHFDVVGGNASDILSLYSIEAQEIGTADT